MRLSATGMVLLLPLLAFSAPAETGPDDRQLDARFTDTIHPFLETYCVKCHSGEKPKGHFDISGYSSPALIARDYSEWSVAADKLTAKEMPPENAQRQPGDEARQAVIGWLADIRKNEARKNAGRK